MEEKRKEYALEYAGFWVRLGAGVIDLLVCGVILGFMVWIIACVFAAVGQDYGVAAVSPSSGDAGLGYSFVLVLILGMIVGWFIGMPYFVGFWVWRGQTPGKLVMGIKVIRTDSSPVTLQYALLRYAGYVVSAAILFVGFICIAFDSHKQGTHDKIADTYVVKLPVRQVVLTQSYARGGVG